VTRRGAHLTEAWEVKAAPMTGSRYSVRAIPFRLTPAAIERGAAALEWRRIDADSRKLHAFLRARVYGVRPLPELAKQGAIWAGVFLVFGLVVAMPQDRKAARMYREGRVERGPVMVTRDEFNRQRQRRGRTRGVGFATSDPQSWRERLLIEWAYGPMARIPLEDEPRAHAAPRNLFTGSPQRVQTLLYSLGSDVWRFSLRRL